jgi:hypothetical protein
MAALARFLRDATWTGVIEPGPAHIDSPRMTAEGSGTHHEIQDGCWIVGDYEQAQFLPNGELTLRWQMHMVCGWSPGEECYVAVTADNYGRVQLMKGKIEGDVLAFETHSPEMSYRLTWDASSPDIILWRNEASEDGKSWALVESYRCRPV